MTVDIPDNVLAQSGLSMKDLMLKLAVILFQEDKLTLGQASRLAGIHQVELQVELASRGIPIHYDDSDLDRDLETLGLKP